MLDVLDVLGDGGAYLVEDSAKEVTVAPAVVSGGSKATTRGRPLRVRQASVR